MLVAGEPPTKSRLCVPSDAVQLHAVVQSMFPTLTVQPGMSVLPAGKLSPAPQIEGAPTSKLPFWNGAANATPAKPSVHRADKMRFISTPGTVHQKPRQRH